LREREREIKQWIVRNFIFLKAFIYVLIMCNSDQ